MSIKNNILTTIFISISFYFALTNCIYINEDNSFSSSIIGENNTSHLYEKINTEKKYIIKPDIITSVYKQYNIKEGLENIKVHTYDNYIYVYDSQSKYLNKKGIEFNIEILSGEFKIYKYLCNFKSCEIDFKSEKLNELFPILGYLSYTVKADKIVDKLNPGQNNEAYSIVIQCITPNCSYQIKYHKIEKYRVLKNGEKFLKYIKNDNINEYIDDKYIIPLNTRSKTIVDLIVYSGDAYLLLTDGAYNDYNMNCTIEDFISNERAIFEPIKNSSNDYEINKAINFENKIHIRTNEGGIYYIYVQTIPDDEESQEILPMETTIMYSIINSTKIEINSNNFDNENFYILFNPINCDLEIEHLAENKTDILITKEQNALMDYGKMSNFISYNIKKYHQTQKDENYCFFMISSYYYNRNNSYILLPESKPFRAILNSHIDTIRIIFPFATTKRNPKILLRISLFSLNNIILVINIGSHNITQFLSQSNDILISKDNIPDIQQQRTVISD